MSEPNFVIVEPETPPEPGRKKRAIVRTAIKFPYADLEVAEGVAVRISEKGGTKGETAQVAAWLGHDTVNSGAFRTRIGSAQTFGLISTKPGEIELTALGFQIVDPKTRAAARVEAFLTVPLYNRLFETFHSGLLPADVGLESEMQHLGVPPKQTDTARQVFARSAKYAGFFDEGDGRLVKPVVTPLTNGGDETPKKRDQRESDDHDDGGAGGSEGESKTITLRGGGVLTLIASVKFLSMPKDDREFVFEVIDKLDDYKARGLLAERATSQSSPSPAEQAAV